jgi:flagellar biosynthesis protein FlhB
MAAGETLPEQRTEMPTDRRMQELRKEGAIFHSPDVEHVLVFITGFMALTRMERALHRSKVRDGPLLHYDWRAASSRYDGVT